MSNNWIENITGEMPVEDDVKVDVILRNNINKPFSDLASNWGWSIYNCDGDITHWRLHKAEEKFLEDAYDKPYYTRPATKTVAPKKQSVHQLAAETFSALSGKPLSENDVKIIVELVNIMEKL